MKLYPKTKPSGVGWLGDVPEHWDEAALKRKLRLSNGGTPSSSEESYWEGDVPWFTPEDLGKNHGKTIKESRRKLTADGLANCGAEITPSGSVIVSTRAPIGHVAVSEVRGCCNQGCRILSATGQAVSTDYVYYNIVAFREVLQSAGKGTTFLELPAGALGAQRLAWPPFAEQTAIAAYLDRETGRIDELVGKKRDLIERLKEKRTALISRTVTRGLPADLPPATLARLEALAGQKLPINPPLKPSGHAWVTDIPTHWKLERLKHVSSLFGRIGFRGYSTDDLVLEGEGAISMSPSNMVNGSLALEKCTWLSWEKYEESPEIKIEANDVVMVKTGSTLGKVAFVESVPHPMTINPQLMIFKQVSCSRRFLFFFLVSTTVQDVIALHNTGSTIPTMTQEGIGKLPIPMPPPSEQQAIAAYLDEETAKLDALVAKVETAIERLQEYRTALITAAVTGKIDVREEVET